MTDRDKLIDLLYDSNVSCDQGIEHLADDITDLFHNITADIVSGIFGDWKKGGEMTDREKLIKLLDMNCGYVAEMTATDLADYLLSHGVTVKEPNKVLTLEETIAAINRVGDKLYIEDKEYPHNTGYDEFGVVRLNPKEREEYGKMWRCWAEKPTEEERRNAKWKE